MFSSITSSNVMRNYSNVISIIQIIFFSDDLWSIRLTAKIDAFFEIAEFFTYR
jgi:amino acid permease